MQDIKYTDYDNCLFNMVFISTNYCNLSKKLHDKISNYINDLPVNIFNNVLSSCNLLSVTKNKFRCPHYSLHDCHREKFQMQTFLQKQINLFQF